MSLVKNGDFFCKPQKMTFLAYVCNIVDIIKGRKRQNDKKKYTREREREREAARDRGTENTGARERDRYSKVPYAIYILYTYCDSL